MEASGCGVMEDVHLDSLDVHDVYGTLDEKTLPNGGIYYEVTDESDDTRFNNISVQNCTVKRVSRTGISVGMTESYELWDGHGGIIPDEVKEKYGHTNVVIRNNYVEEAGGDAIVPMFSISPLIEYNISNKASVNTKDQWTMYNAAIWPWRCEDAVFQFNEAYDTYENGDGQAYDCDWSRHTTYQYNYSHNHKGGFILVCQNEALDSVIRYNVSQNDEDSLFLMSNPANADVYNNTFYIGPNLKEVVDSNGKATLKTTFSTVRKASSFRTTIGEVDLPMTPTCFTDLTLHRMTRIKFWQILCSQTRAKEEPVQNPASLPLIHWADTPCRRIRLLSMQASVSRTTEDAISREILWERQSRTWEPLNQTWKNS